MKILIATPCFTPENSGYANAISSFARAVLEHTNHSVHVVTLSPLGNTAEVSHPRLTVTRARSRKASRFIGYIENEICFTRALARHDLDGFDAIMVETLELPVSTLFLLQRGDARRRAFVRLHGCTETEWTFHSGPLLYRLRRGITKLALTRFRHITATCDYYLEFTRRVIMRGDVIIAARKSYWRIPNTHVRQSSVATDTFGSVEEIVRWVNGRTSFLTLGRLSEEGLNQKNIHRLIEAFAIARSRGGESNICLVVIGDGSQWPRLESLVENLGLHDCVRMIRRLPNAEIQALQSRCDVAALVSTYEGMSSFATECASNGCLLLFSKNNGIEALVSEKRNGVLVDALDLNSIADGILECTKLAAHTEADTRKQRIDEYEKRWGAPQIIREFEQWLQLLTAQRK